MFYGKDDKRYAVEVVKKYFSTRLIVLHFMVPAIALLALLPSLEIAPITDDYRNIETANGISFEAVISDLKNGSWSGPHYRPMEPLSYRMDYAFAHFLAWKPRYTNYLIHIIASWLVVQITVMLTGHLSTGLMAGSMFAVHPSVVPSIVWISGRTTGLLCMFLLFSTYLYLKYRTKNDRLYLAASLFVFGLALLSKEQAFLFPVFLFVFAGLKGGISRDALPVLGYAGIAALVIFVGLIPSGVLNKETYFSSPFSFASQRLAEDIFVLLAAISVIDFKIRDILLSMAVASPWLVAIIWVACVLILAAPLTIKKTRKAYLCALIWVAIGLAPLRGLQASIFTIANIYFIVPVVTLGCAVILHWLFRRYRTAAISAFSGILILFSVNLVAAQGNLKKMGDFSKSLHTILKGSTMEEPGPLKIVINLPDPFRITSFDKSLAHFIIFRIVQSAWKLGGYSESKTLFVERRVIQTVLVDYEGDCCFKVQKAFPEKLLIKLANDDNENDECFTHLNFIDFNGQHDDSLKLMVAERQKKYAGFPVTKAEIYVFDGKVLRRVHLEEHIQ